MSLNHTLFLFLFLLVFNAGVCATETPVIVSDDLSLSSAGTASESGIVTATDFQALDTNISEIFGIAPLNPEFVSYQETMNQAQEDGTPTEHGFGLIPSPFFYPELADARMDNITVQEFDATFDLREMGKVSPVRDQGHFGTCWAFATLGSLESNLLPDANHTFSSKNMVNRHGFDLAYNDGGQFYMSTAYLSRWDGPVDEESDPYPVKNWTGSDAYPPVYHAQNAIMLPGRSNSTDIGLIKAGLQQWGAAGIAFYWNNTFYNETSYSYYQPESAPDLKPGSGHGVTLIGWNDTFPASAFNEKPPGDGAWILKNSWGSDWGDNGFFYISYYDKYIGTGIDPDGGLCPTTFFTAEPSDNYEDLYLHDPLGACRNYYIGEPKTGTVASRFQATTSEILSAIGFYTNDINTRYEAVIYRNATNGPLGTEAARFKGNLTWMGYHTVNLPKGSEVPINKGENFSVVLSLENAVYPYPVSMELPLAGYSSNATANPGESYFYVPIYDFFVDLTEYDPNISACVRAYTTSLPEPTPTPTPAPLKASFTAKPVKGQAPLTVQFTDTSAGNPTKWLWSFGSGPQSEVQNPEITYTEPGKYTVSLIVRKYNEVDRISKYHLITVQNSTDPYDPDDSGEGLQ